MAQLVGEVVVTSLAVGEGVLGVAVVVKTVGKEEQLDKYANLCWLMRKNHVVPYVVNKHWAPSL